MSTSNLGPGVIRTTKAKDAQTSFSKALLLDPGVKEDFREGDALKQALNSKRVIIINEP